MATLKVYKRFSTARENAIDQPILRVGSGSSSIYVIGMHSIDEVAIIGPDGSITGNIIMKHLDRLGNGNHATAKNGKDYLGSVPPLPRSQRKALPDEGHQIPERKT